MSPQASFKTRKFVTRIGPHHFAHLRAIAEGIDPKVSAAKYLCIEHGHEAITANRQTIDAVRAIARMHAPGSGWRLIGLTIRPKKTLTPEQLKSAQKEAVKAHVPTLEDFIAERDLDGWSEDEVLLMYAEAFPPSFSEKKPHARRELLRQRQMALLQKLEGVAVELPDANHLVTGWFDDVTATRMIVAGLVTLGNLHAAIRAAGRWLVQNHARRR